MTSQESDPEEAFSPDFQVSEAQSKDGNIEGPRSDLIVLHGRLTRKERVTLFKTILMAVRSEFSSIPGLFVETHYFGTTWHFCGVEAAHMRELACSALSENPNPRWEVFDVESF